MENIIKLYFDGTAEPNPGYGGYGFLVKLNDKEIYKFGMNLGNYITNNQAEHLGLYHGLTWLYQNGYSNYNVLVLGDSELVIHQVFGKWQCKSDNIKLVYQMNLALVREFRKIKAEWIAGETNPADSLSRLFL